MHTTTIRAEGREWTVHHNGDYSGDVHIFIETYNPEKNVDADRVQFIDNSRQREYMKPLIHAPDDMASDGYEIKIPFEIMKSLVADKLRDDMISRLEDMGVDELLASRVRVDFL